MKLIKCVKILVILMVILNVFTKKVNRSKAASNLLSQLDDLALVATDCKKNVDGPDPLLKELKQYLNTDSLKNGASGFKLINKSDKLACKYMTFIGTRYQKNHYFVSFRDFQNIDEPIEGFYFGNQRALQIYVKEGYYYNFFTLDWVSAGIRKRELQDIIKNLIFNKSHYLSRFRTLKGKLQSIRIDAEDKTAQKNKNIHTRLQLKEEVTTKLAELALIKDALNDLTTKSDAVKLQIRNFGSEIDSIKIKKLNPLMDTLQVQLQQIDSIQKEIKQNNHKIAGIKHINQNDLSASITKLISKLKALNASYLEADPRHSAIKDIVDNFATKQMDLPNVIA